MAGSVLITGGTRGIGRAAVKAFARAGWRVAFTYRENRAAAASLLEEFPHAVALAGDVSHRDEAERCVAEARVCLGPLDALVCNAGIAQQKMFCDLTNDDWDRMLGVNLMGAVHFIRAVLPDLIHKKQGSIVTVSSVWGIEGASCESHYAASKAALIGLSRSLAAELGPSGIRVNCVAPGVIDTEMNAAHTEDTIRTLAEQTPLGRMGTAEEVAQTILFLCSDSASFITGQTISVTGGF